MSVVDIVVIVLLVSYAVAGYTQGLIVGVASFIGFVGGALVGLRLGPVVLQGLSPGLGTAVLGLILVLVLATLGQGIASWLGSIVRSRVRWQSARVVDALGGALFSGLALVLAAWAIGLAAASSSIPNLSAAIRDSKVLGFVDGRLPDGARATVGHFRDLVDAGTFPAVVLPFEPEPIAGVQDPSPVSARSAAVRAAAGSVVKVLGQASSCSRVMEGSAFSLGDKRYMTNAHVVAGATRTVVVDRSGARHDAQVVYVDSRTDVAVLLVPDLALPGLRFDGDVRPAKPAAVLGYPRNGPFTATPVRVRSERVLVGQDIYGSGPVSREVIAVRGSVQPGNSGGPLVSEQGRVLGVVFAASLTDPETGYALAYDEVAAAARTAAGRASPVATGACAAG